MLLLQQNLNPLTYVKKLFFIGAVCLAFAGSASAQNGKSYWKRLQRTHPETTLEALDRNTPAVSQVPSGQTDLPACRLALVYEGKSRNISLENLKRMKQKGLKPSSIRQYRKEILFTSADKEVWLPVKSALVGQLELEVREDEPVLVYATVLQDDQVTLLVEDFQTK
ncbi:hypothetical protein DC20_01925 [Rufibacter tibetensis]|uniref:Uncharacterized protein n=1 Tax=Rufibacter tibetensis TaxID=512763 RepID=A0A0P0BZN2_9BACT|nr:hypothetical protein DC20_01925 [Rufibacter tibetensis]